MLLLHNRVNLFMLLPHNRVNLLSLNINKDLAAKRLVRTYEGLSFELDRNGELSR